MASAAAAVAAAAIAAAEIPTTPTDECVALNDSFGRCLPPNAAASSTSSIGRLVEEKHDRRHASAQDDEYLSDREDEG
jgi:hypothetical protein